MKTFQEYWKDRETPTIYTLNADARAGALASMLDLWKKEKQKAIKEGKPIPDWETYYKIYQKLYPELEQPK
jgi:hypothetical protein